MHVRARQALAPARAEGAGARARRGAALDHRLSTQAASLQPYRELFAAPALPGVGRAKYDDIAAALILLLQYGCRLPFNRVERLGENVQIPLPAATQCNEAFCARGFG